MAEIPQTRYARSGDADIAYQVFGSGEDMVGIHGLTSHLEVMWELPEFAAFLDRLGSFRRVIVFDKRGTGMSDRVCRMPAVEQHVQDIIAVMQAAGSARASVMGWADGAFVAAMLAATHPDLVSALVLSGLWVTVPGGQRPAADQAVVKTLSDRVQAGWRQGLVAPVLAPSYADDEHFRSWWCRCETYSASPRDAAALLGWAASVDPEPGTSNSPAPRPCPTWVTRTPRWTRSRSSSPAPAARRTRTGPWPRYARAGEVLVTSTVQMLVLGSGITFADRGDHAFKGVPGQWHLSAVTNP